MIDRCAIEQSRTAERIVALWDDSTLAGDIGELSKRLYRSTGVDPSAAARVIHGERFNRARRS
jgi:hypothetical protein